MQHFVADMKVSEALAHHPHARWVFAAYHLNGCTTCVSAQEETLAELAVAYKISLDRFVADLNSLPDIGRASTDVGRASARQAG